MNVPRSASTMARSAWSKAASTGGGLGLGLVRVRVIWDQFKLGLVNLGLVRVLCDQGYYYL